MDKSILTLERHATWLLLHLERCFARCARVHVCILFRAFTMSGSNCRGEGIAGSLSPVYLRVAEWRGHQGSEHVSQILILWGPCALRQSHVWRENGLTRLTAGLSSLLHPCTKYIFTAPVSGATLAWVRWCFRGTYLVSQLFSARCFTHLFIFVNSK